MSFPLAVLGKVMEQLRGPSCTNTPAKESGIRVYKPQLSPVNGLRCEKPVRKPQPNRTFHRYCTELWSIKAARASLCPYCKQSIQPGEEITLFEKVGGWSHLHHATQEEALMPQNRRLNQ